MPKTARLWPAPVKRLKEGFFLSLMSHNSRSSLCAHQARPSMHQYRYYSSDAGCNKRYSFEVETSWFFLHRDQATLAQMPVLSLELRFPDGKRKTEWNLPLWGDKNQINSDGQRVMRG